MLGRLVDAKLRRFGALHPWGNVLSLLSDADLTVVNLECIIASGGQPWARWPKVFHFRADPLAIESLKAAGVDCVVLANNHVLDYEETALLEMLELLDQNNIAHAGAGRHLEEAARPAMLRAGGASDAVVAFTDNEPGWRATADAPGVNYIQVSLEEESLRPVAKAIRQARELGADLVIFSIHWGPNMVERPLPLFREFARKIMDLGADVFHGHSAHVFQGIELYKGKPIVYDAGDFVDDYHVDPDLRNDQGLLFRLRTTGRVIEGIELIPTRISNCQVNLATEAEQGIIIERIAALSAEMGTSIDRGGEHPWIQCSSTSNQATSPVEMRKTVP